MILRRAYALAIALTATSCADSTAPDRPPAVRIARLWSDVVSVAVSLEAPADTRYRLIAWTNSPGQPAPTNCVQPDGAVPAGGTTVAWPCLGFAWVTADTWRDGAWVRTDCARVLEDVPCPARIEP